MCVADSALNCTSAAEKLSTLISHQKILAVESLDGEVAFPVSDTGNPLTGMAMMCTSFRESLCCLRQVKRTWLSLPLGGGTVKDPSASFHYPSSSTVPFSSSPSTTGQKSWPKG